MQPKFKRINCVISQWIPFLYSVRLAWSILLSRKSWFTCSDRGVVLPRVFLPHGGNKQSVASPLLCDKILTPVAFVSYTAWQSFN